MQQFTADVLEVEELSPALRLIWLKSDLLKTMASGQFVMARCGDGFDPLLRRALSLHRGPRNDGTAGFLFGLGKFWGAWLGSRRPGDGVDLIGPLGRGFRRNGAARHLLLAAEGLGVAPLIALAEEGIAAGCNVTLVADAPDASGLYPVDRLPEELEVVTLTRDGSAGRKGKVLDALVDLQPWADQIFLAGSAGLLDDVKSLLKRAMSSQQAQAIVEERMACGVGACLGCVVHTNSGAVASCVAGPVFDLWSLAA